MAKYRKVSLGMWADERFRRLSKPQPNAQSLWQWLLTGPRTTQIPGIVLGTLDELAASIRWVPEGFRDAFAELSREGLVRVDHPGAIPTKLTDDPGLVWLPNAPRHNKPESPNGVRSWRSAWEDTPECALKTQVWRELKAFAEGWGSPFAQAFGDACPQPLAIQDQEQEQEQDKTPASAGELLPSLPIRIAIVPRFDFAAAFAAYPNRLGSKRAAAIAQREVRTTADYDALVRAIANYSATAKPGFTAHLSTFMGRWRDYIDPTPVVQAPDRAWMAGLMKTGRNT